MSIFRRWFTANGDTDDTDGSGEGDVEGLPDGVSVGDAIVEFERGMAGRFRTISRDLDTLHPHLDSEGRKKLTAIQRELDEDADAWDEMSEEHSEDETTTTNE